MTKQAAILLLIGIPLVATAPLDALEYEIRLHNGNVFHTRYEPVEAPFDASRLLFMTTFGNPVTIAKDKVAEVISLTDASGFGKRLDATTVLIGLAPNDNPTPEEEAALAAQGAGQLEAPSPYSAPLTSEPEATGGIPLHFLNFNTPPIGGGAFTSGGAADLRRTGGGSQFVEPQTRD